MAASGQRLPVTGCTTHTTLKPCTRRCGHGRGQHVLPASFIAPARRRVAASPPHPFTCYSCSTQHTTTVPPFNPSTLQSLLRVSSSNPPALQSRLHRTWRPWPRQFTAQAFQGVACRQKKPEKKRTRSNETKEDQMPYLPKYVHLPPRPTRALWASPVDPNNPPYVQPNNPDLITKRILA
jgi:hypothetical protein